MSKKGTDKRNNRNNERQNGQGSGYTPLPSLLCCQETVLPAEAEETYPIARCVPKVILSKLYELVWLIKTLNDFLVLWGLLDPVFTLSVPQKSKFIRKQGDF